MEVALDKRYDIAAGIEQAWTVLCDIRATAGCMPGAAITEQLDATHFKGTVRSKVGPAMMTFGGDIEVLGIDAAARQLRMLGKGADKGGSSASMELTAHLEPGAGPDTCVLVGHAAVIVNGKLAQFGSRLLVPVSDMMLAQFAQNFSAAAAAVPVEVEAVATVPAETPVGMPGTPADRAAGAAPFAGAPIAAGPLGASPPVAAKPASPLPRRVARAPVQELNALTLVWTLFKGWLGGLFGKRA